ncbi:MAG: hypothetical protein N0E48_03345, partial [Candidatus Thiodiazotropha endolucinida]|nr:hypothetical protein [Candidatus Thiodiazotropha taylori]MCW4342396.1 hypothetical protein [Candidatus Thiodiazotropha endolucinida]
KTEKTEKVNNSIQEEAEEMETTKDVITKQLAEMNTKLSNVMTKDDGSLRTIIKEVFQQMKDAFLASVNKRIEILEGRLFERHQDNENLNKTVNSLNKTVTNLNGTIDGLKTQVTGKQKEIDDQKAENKRLTEQVATLTLNTEAKMNELEQYSRKTILESVV